MKKLNLVGIKKGWFGRRIKKIIAVIYVKDGRVMVESKCQKIKKQLQAEIDKVAYDGVFGIPKYKNVKDAKGRVINNEVWEQHQKPKDPQFLEAFKASTWFWFDKEYDDYKINPLISDIVEK